jgi:hypothetical protein
VKYTSTNIKVKVEYGENVVRLSAGKVGHIRGKEDKTQQMSIDFLKACINS